MFFFLLFMQICHLPLLLLFLVLTPTGRLDAGQRISSQGFLMFSPRHGHVRHRQQGQLQGDQHAGPGPAHQLPQRRLGAGTQPELYHVGGRQPDSRNARQRHYENI